jgi:hypothetical protein
MRIDKPTITKTVIIYRKVNKSSVRLVRCNNWVYIHI